MRFDENGRVPAEAKGAWLGESQALFASSAKKTASPKPKPKPKAARRKGS